MDAALKGRFRMFSHRLVQHFACAAAVTVVAGAANAAVVYSGIQNFVCAVDIDGCYINVETNTLSNGPGSGVLGWDVNPYSSGGGMNFFNSTGVVFGSAAGNWQYSAENIIGFRFVAAAGITHYGWMRFQMGAAGSSGTSMTRTVVDYGWESDAAVAITAGAGAIPAPGAIALLGLAGLAGRRRR
jgi:MYXO-CTERM domain-containing protein